MFFVDKICDIPTIHVQVFKRAGACQRSMQRGPEQPTSASPWSHTSYPPQTIRERKDQSEFEGMAGEHQCPHQGETDHVHVHRMPCLHERSRTVAREHARHVEGSTFCVHLGLERHAEALGQQTLWRGQPPVALRPEHQPDVFDDCHQGLPSSNAGPSECILPKVKRNEIVLH